MAFRTVEHEGFVEFVATGRVTERELLESIQSQTEGRADMRELWNFSAADITTLDARRFQETARAAVSMGNVRPAGARTALLMGNREDVLLAKAFAAWSEMSADRPMEAFDDRAAALAWLLDGR